jgi:AcrR family transcriptional regulator
MYPRRVCAYDVRINPLAPCHARDVPRPKSLTEDQIATAALAVLDREGLAGLSMRTVAKELGVGTMSLYRYVDSKEHLELLLLAFALRGLDTSPPPGRWDEQVRVLVQRVRRELARHPAMVPLLLQHRQSTALSLAWGDSVMAALDEGGHHGADRAVAFRTLLAYVLGAAQLEHLGAIGGAGTAALADLPEEAHPWVRDTARAARRLSVSQEQERGLEVLLRGLGAPSA